MTKYCGNCGTPLNDDERFCPTCGNQVSPMAQPVNPMANRPAYAPQRQAPEKKRIGLKIFLIVALVAVLGYGGWEYFNYREAQKTHKQNAPEYTQSKPKVKTKPGQEQNSAKKSDNGTVNKDNPSVTLCGVTVDVSPDMLKDGAKQVSVTVKGTTVDEDGTSSDNYELEMGGHQRFETPVKVTFPYKPSAGTDPVVEHYDAGKGVWQPLFSFVDEGDKTVSAYFGSFSPARVSHSKNTKLFVVRTPSKDAPYVKNIEISPNYLKNALRIKPSEYMPAIEKYKNDPEKRAVALPKPNPGMDMETAYQTFMEASTLWGYCDPLINLAIETLPQESQNHVVQYIIDHTGQLGDIMNAVPFVVMGVQLTHDLHKAAKNPTKENLNTTAINLYKSLIGAEGNIYSMATGFSHIGFTLAFFGVSLFGMELDYFVDAAKAEQAANVEAVFNAYYSETAPFDADHWYNIFHNAYWHSNGDVNEAMEEVKEAVDEYCDEFWEKVYKDSNDDLAFSTAMADYKNVFLNATPEQKEALTEKQKKKVWEQIEWHTMDKIQAFLTERMQEKTFEQLYNHPIIEEYNKNIVIYIEEDLASESGHSNYYGRTICLGTAEKPFMDWHFNVDDSDVEDENWYDNGWETKFLPCTFYGYMLMGMPNQVLVYENEKDFKNGKKPIEAIDFELSKTSNVTTINLNKKTNLVMSDNYVGDHFINKMLDMDGANDFRAAVEDALHHTHLKLQKDGSFNATGSGTYMEKTGQTVQSRKMTSRTSGKIDKATGRGTFKMQVDVDGFSAFDVSGDVTQVIEENHATWLQFSGEGSAIVISGGKEEKVDIGEVIIYFKPE